MGARVVESGPGGQDLAADTWQRLEVLPDPRSPQGRIYPLACLIAIAVSTFTATGNDWFTAVGLWVRRAGQADLARPRASWDPLVGRYRAPDKKTIRVVLDRLDHVPWPRPCSGRARAERGAPAGHRRPACATTVPGVPPAGKGAGPQSVGGSGRGRQDVPRGPVAPTAPGSSSSAPPNAAGTSWIKSRSATGTTRPAISSSSWNPRDLAGAVVTFDALHTVRANLNWLVEDKQAHYIAVVEKTSRVNGGAYSPLIRPHHCPRRHHVAEQKGGRPKAGTLR